jgi:hypothetical protein
LHLHLPYCPSCRRCMKCALVRWWCPCAVVQALGDEPIWRQVLWHHRDHSDAEVVKQVAAALAEIWVPL